MTGQTLSAERKSTPLESVVNDLSNQLERMAKNTSRLDSIGNKFRDDGGSIKDGGNSECKPPALPGIISMFDNYVSMLENYNRTQDNILSKLEELI